MEVRDLRAAVQSAMNALDPEGLLRMSAPDDEYDPEIDDFVGAIARDREVTEEFVRATWARWFDPTPGDRTGVTAARRAGTAYSCIGYAPASPS